MKTIAIATLVLFVLGLSVPQNKPDMTKTRTVSAATIAKLSPGKTYEIDLTHSGTVYKFNGEGTDFRRVTIRTAAGIENFADLLKRSNTSLKGRLTLGTPADMRTHLPASKGAKTNYDCGVFCKCNGIIDCGKLIFGGHCGGDFWCSDDTGNCFCVALP